MVRTLEQQQQQQEAFSSHGGSGLGLGRGRERTLPAWITAQDNCNHRSTDLIGHANSVASGTDLTLIPGLPLLAPARPIDSFQQNNHLPIAPPIPTRSGEKKVPKPVKKTAPTKLTGEKKVPKPVKKTTPTKLPKTKKQLVQVLERLNMTSKRTIIFSRFSKTNQRSVDVASHVDAQSEETFSQVFCTLSDPLNVFAVGQGRRKKLDSNQLVRVFKNDLLGKMHDEQFLQMTVAEACATDSNQPLRFEIAYEEPAVLSDDETDDDPSEFV